VFDETTPAKSAATAYDVVDVVDENDVDVVVGVGGGSSLNVAQYACAIKADGRSLSELRADARDGDLDTINPADPDLSVVVVPTTFAGADMASGGSLTVLASDESPTGLPVHVRGRITPVAIIEDPALFETTPLSALAGSAMNGFDKAVETLYARDATPITDATKIHSLRYLDAALPRLGDDDPAVMERAVVGIVLAQYERQSSIVHAFGHALARHYPVQQGVAHGVVVPHVLRYLFDEIDGERELLALGLGIDTTGRSADEVADAIVHRVVDIRDALGLPTQLRDLDPVSKSDIPALAEYVMNDHAMDRAPAGLDATQAEIEAVFEVAW
jgi:alcohol dehydrogenase class IV